MTAPGLSLAERGRRAGAAALLMVVSAGVAEAIVTNPEPTPAALLAPAPTTPATGRAAPPGAASSPTTTAAKSQATPAAPATTKPADPRALAVAWYADRHRLDRAKVTALQADKLNSATARYRVLLLVVKPGGRLDSAVVTVARSGSGWKVAGR